MRKTLSTMGILAATFFILVPLSACLGYMHSRTANEWYEKAMKESKPDQLIEYLTNAIEADPNYIDAYDARGFAYGVLGRYAEAVADYTKAIELNPGYAYYYSVRGAAYYRLERYDLAVADLTKAVDLDPYYLVEAYNDRGLAYHQLGEKEKSLSDFKKACRMGFQEGCENYEKYK